MGIRLYFQFIQEQKKALNEVGIDINFRNENLLLTEPVSYFEMLALEKNAKLIITDSGGVQKEGYFWGTPCVIPRNETEWIELVEIGFNKLAGNKSEEIIKCSLEILNGEKQYNLIEHFYGKGDASDKIVFYIIHPQK